ncbi:head GIN domain-containing protein [Chitinophaga sp. YIM B06452]|uniref:head GIN domain-containing protein n=1 Tax=Chitinophaga sp. YIM B06452 TaxID=3082158 RepID=UPI0031FEC010
MKTQLKYLLPLLLFIPFLSACEGVSGSGNVIKETREVGPFRALEVSGSMDVYVSQGNSTTVTLEGEDNILPEIELVTEGDKLEIRFKRNMNIRTHRDVKVFLSAKTLEGVELSGSGDVELSGIFNSPAPVHISLAGSGDIKGVFNAPEISMDLAGSGDIELKGETRDVRISLAGSGNCDAGSLLAETADVNIAGSGNVDLHASRELKTNILGSGNVYYKGEPSVSSSKIGSGTVKKKD